MPLEKKRRFSPNFKQLIFSFITTYYFGKFMYYGFFTAADMIDDALFEYYGDDGDNDGTKRDQESYVYGGGFIDRPDYYK